MLDVGSYVQLKIFFSLSEAWKPTLPTEWPGHDDGSKNPKIP